MKSLARALFLSLLFASVAVAAGCGDDDPGDDTDTSGDGDGDGDNVEEVITTVTLTFAPDSENRLEFTFDDPDGDGGGAPTVDTITLVPNTVYTVSAEFTNRLANPEEDITEEIGDEAEEHQIFILGSSVSGPATDVAEADALVAHAYADVESDYGPNAEGSDLPVGLLNTITTVNSGTGGQLRLVLRHLPPVNDTVVKTDGLAGDVAAGGISSIAGDSDIDITFDLVVE